jgi:hypothetical protein
MSGDMGMLNTLSGGGGGLRHKQRSKRKQVILRGKGKKKRSR